MFKSKLKTRQLLVGGWNSIPSSDVAEIIAKTSVDWVAIDLEHSLYDLKTLKDSIRAIQGVGNVAFVRLPDHGSTLIKQVLDFGIDGLIVPSVDSADQAVSIMRACRYMPMGARGVGLGRAQNYGASFDSYLQSYQSRLTTILQIESATGVSNLPEILSVEGVDGIFVGPYDLSCSLGCPGDFSSPEFLRALGKIKTVCGVYEVPMGIHVVQPCNERLANYIEAGFSFIAYGVDFTILSHGLETSLEIRRS